VVLAQRERCKTLKEMAENSVFFYRDFEQYDEKAAKKNLNPAALEPLRKLYQQFEALDGWEPETLHQIVLDTAESLDLKLAKVAQPLRVSLSGSAVSPPIDVTLHLLGREKVLERLQRAINHVENISPSP